jgi:MFS family permease
MKSDLRRPARRSLVASNALDAGGRSIFGFATDVIAVSVLGASAAQMGLLNAAGLVAFLVLAAPVGVLVDRASSRSTLVISSLAKATLAALAAALLLSATMTFGMLLVIVVAFGIFSLITETSQVAAVPRVEKRSRIAALAGTLEAWDNGLGIVIPAAAAVALTYIAGGWVLAAAAAVLAGAAVMASRLRVHRAEQDVSTEPRPPGSSSLLTEMRAGIEPFRTSAALRRITMSTVLLNASLAIISAVEMVYFLRVVGLSVAAVGAAATVGAVGGALSAGVSGRLVARLGLNRVVRVTSVVLFLAAGLLLTLSLPVPAIVLTLIICAQSFIWGMAQVAKNVAVYSWFTTVVPVDLLGRASGLQRTATMGVIPIASLIGGLLGSWNILASLSLGVVLILASGVWVWSVRPEAGPEPGQSAT